jgi:hypothetical protein
MLCGESGRPFENGKNFKRKSPTRDICHEDLAVPGTKYTNLAIGAIGASKSLEAPVIEPRPINLNINTIKPHYTILTDMLPQTNCIEFKGSNIHFNL